MPRMGTLVGTIAGLGGISLGTYLGVVGALSQPNPADVGASLGVIGALLGASCAALAIIWQRFARH